MDSGKLYSTALVAASLLAMGRANAQDYVPIENGSFTYDNLSFSITDCAFTPATGIGACGNTANSGTVALDGTMIVNFSSSTGLSFSFVNANTADPLLSVVSTGTVPAVKEDLTLDIAISGTDIAQVGTSITSSIAGTSSGNVYISTEANSEASTLLDQYSNGTQTLNGTTVSSPTFTFSSNTGTNAGTIDLTYDIRDSAASIASGTTVSLLSAGTGIAPVPEPASFALLGAGIAALAAIRRRRGGAPG